MNIVVCVKQVPAPNEHRFDETTRTLVREGVMLTLSSLDRRALLEALRLRGEVGGTVTVLTMGPAQARSALMEALALGADRGVQLTDALFAGADTLATARTLARALDRLAPDLVVCGKFTIDSETSQVPSEIAEILDLPQITSARKIRPTEGERVLLVERETDEGYEQYEITLPAVLSVTELVISGRRPSPEDLAAADGSLIETWSAADLGGDTSVYGAAGSPTWVAEHRPANLDRGGPVVSGESAEEGVRRILDYLLEHGLFQPRQFAGSEVPGAGRRGSPDPTKSIWVLAELLGGRARPVTYELLGSARELAESLGGEVAAVLIGPRASEALVADLGAAGADTVYLAAADTLAQYDTERYTAVLADAIREHKPHIVLAPSTTNGRDLAPRVAARLGVGLTGDCIGLELDAKGRLAQLKPAFGGNVVSPIYSRTVPVMATVRPGMLAPRRPDATARPRVVTLPAPTDGRGRVRLLASTVEEDLGAVRLDDADVVVVVGMGIGGPENLPVVRDLVEATGGALAASLRVASAGWLPPQLQVGLTGKAVSPRFYIAVGVSGQSTHLVGARRAEHIVAINSDPEAPIFTSSDFGVVGDWAQVAPALAAAIRGARERMGS